MMEEIDKKKEVEIEAVRMFLKLNGKILNPSKADFFPEDPIVDVFCRDLNEKFQVTTAPAELEGAVGKLDKKEKVSDKHCKAEWREIGGIRTKSWEWSYKLDEGWKFFVVDPIERKRKRYAPEALKDITLLIYLHHAILPPWIETELETFKKRNSAYLRGIGFKEISLFDWKKRIQIFP